MLTTVDLFYFIMCEDPHEYKLVVEITFGWGSGHIWLHTTLEGPWPHYMILKVCWDGLWTLSFGLSRFHGHGSWLVCGAALSQLSFCAIEQYRNISNIQLAEYSLDPSAWTSPMWTCILRFTIHWLSQERAFPSQTLTFDWCVVMRGSKNKHHKDTCSN